MAVSISGLQFDWNRTGICYVRWYSDSDFLDSDGIDHPAQPTGGTDYLEEVTCTVASGLATAPTFNLPATWDSATNLRATLTGYVLDSNRQLAFVIPGGGNIRIPPTPSPTTWTAIRLFNTTHATLRDTSVYTKIETNLLLESLVSAPLDAAYLLKTPSAALANAQAMSALATGLVYNTTATGTQSTIANGSETQVLTVVGGVPAWAASGGGGVSSQWITNGSSIYYNTGNVGIGEANPGAKLSVSGGLAVGSAYDITAVADGGGIFSSGIGLGTSTLSGVLNTLGASNFTASSNTTGAVVVNSASGTPATRNDTFKVVIDSTVAIAVGVGDDIGPSAPEKRFVEVNVPIYFGNDNDPTLNYVASTYQFPVRIRDTYSGNPNSFAKYQGLVVWKNLTDLTASTIGTVDIYGIDAEAGISDTLNTRDFFQIIGVNAIGFVRGSGAITGAMTGSVGRVLHQGTGTVASSRGATGWTRNLSTGTITDAKGQYGIVSNETTGVIGNVVVTDSLFFSNAGSVTGSVYIIRARAETSGAGTISGNRYGVYIADQGVGSVSGSIYNFFSAGASRINVIEGSLGVGTTAPDKALEVNSASGANLRLTYNDSTGSATVFADFSMSSGGNLTIAPTGDIELDPVGNDILPVTGYDLNLGSISKKYLSLHAAELVVETLVAQSTIATIGGRILVGPTTTLTSDLAPAATSIIVKHNNLASGDRVYMEGGGQVEFMAVTSGASGVGPYTYSVTRNLDGTGADQWFAGDAVFNTGQTGNGFIDIYSFRGVRAGTEVGPTIAGNIRNSATFNDWSTNWAIGNLNGLYGYGVTTFGVALGKYAASNSWIGIDSTNGIRIVNGTATVIGQWDTSGVITVGQVASGQSNIRISAGDLQIRNNTTVLGEWDDAGVITVGQVASGQSNIRISAGDLQIRNNTTVLGEWDDAGVITVGEVGASKSNVRISSGALSLRNNTTERISLSAAGVLEVKDSGGAAVITLDASAGAEITKKLTMPGASSAIAIGSTPPTSASAGTGIWIDRTGLYGLASNVEQVKINASTGQVIAGAGDVEMDVDGLTLIADTSDKTSNSVKWFNSTTGTNIARVNSLRAGSPAGTTLLAQSFSNDGTGYGQLTLAANNSSNAFASLTFTKYGASHASKAGIGYVTFNALGVAIDSTSAGGYEPTASTVLDLKSTTGAVLFPRMSTAQKNALTAVDGMVLFDSDLVKLQVRAGGAWVDLH